MGRKRDSYCRISLHLEIIICFIGKFFYQPLSPTYYAELRRLKITNIIGNIQTPFSFIIFWIHNFSAFRAYAVTEVSLGVGTDIGLNLIPIASVIADLLA